LQRKIKLWRALFGPEKEVIFRQIHEPVELTISDFTHPKTIKVTIKGEVLEHIFYHFRLVYRGFNYMQVFRGSGEFFNALSEGIKGALNIVGGAPKTHRTDSLAAAYKNVNTNEKNDLTDRYRAFIEHYGMTPTRINPGESQENSVVESSHGHIKNRIVQSLIVRGSNDFDSFEDYQKFIQEVTTDHDKKNVKNLAIEQSALKSLPETKAIDYTEVTAIVSPTSTIDIKRVTYTVPSRLIGEKLNVKIYTDKFECYLDVEYVLTLIKGAIPPRGKRTNVVNYVHIIYSLVKKPEAFRGYRLREFLSPDDNYKFI
jgi:hypothetical protein